MSLYEKSPMPIVYLDESGFAQSMPRLYGYAPKGSRCYGEHDWQAKGRINVIGAIIEHQLITVSLFECNVNADVFYSWVTQDLLPKLSEASVIVMDNASFHKREDILTAIKKAGHIIEWLPPYSPDLNPIEHKWAEIKRLRRTRQCTIDELFTMHLVDA